MNKKAVVFDVDGVLLDTVPYHFKAWKKLFKSQGVNFTFKQYLQKVNGLPRLTGIQNILPSLDKSLLDYLAGQKQNYFTEFIEKIPPKPLAGAFLLLNVLINKKFILAAASSSKNALRLLEKAGLSSYLTVIVGGNDFSKPKPDPELFLLTSKKLNIEPKHCTVVEDSFLGIQAAKKAGMKTIGLLSSRDNEIRDIADITVQTLKNTDIILRFLESV